MSQIILGLDVGHKRIGVAMGNTEVGLASPLLTLQHDATVWDQLTGLVTEHAVSVLVLGLPRGLDGQETEQTRQTQAFGEQVKQHVDVLMQFQDEAMTSVMAKAELEARGKPYVKDMIDALAASYILQDYLDNQRKQTGEHAV